LKAGPPVALKHKEAEYLALLKFSGIAENASDRLQQLRTVPWEKLVEAVTALGISLFHSLADASFFDRGVPSYWSEGGTHWELRLGRCYRHRGRVF